jgi:hypothetical protein
MKFLQAAAFATILALGGSPYCSAQEPEQPKEKQKQQDEEKKKQTPPKPKAQPKTEQPPKAETQLDREKQDQDQRKRPQDARKEQEKADKREQKQSAPESGQTTASRPGSHKNVRRISREHFQASFGSQHHFRVERRNDRRFQYGGYWFEYVEVWPAEWSYDDDCYIEEDGDDYFLVDVGHPGIRVLVVIVG